MTTLQERETLGEVFMAGAIGAMAWIPVGVTCILGALLSEGYAWKVAGVLAVGAIYVGGILLAIAVELWAPYWPAAIAGRIFAGAIAFLVIGAGGVIGYGLLRVVGLVNPL